MGLTSALETKAEVLGSTHDRLNTGLREPCRRYVARYMNTNHNQSTNKSEIVEAIPMYVEELLLLLTCYVEGTS